MKSLSHRRESNFEILDPNSPSSFFHKSMKIYGFSKVLLAKEQKVTSGSAIKITLEHSFKNQENLSESTLLHA